MPICLLLLSVHCTSVIPITQEKMNNNYPTSILFNTYYFNYNNEKTDGPLYFLWYGHELSSKIRPITEAGLKEMMYACICLILSFFEARHMIIC